MRFQGSKIARIECSECQAHSPEFRVYLYNDFDVEQWDGKLPLDWTTYDEAELEDNNTILGRCPKHPVF